MKVYTDDKDNLTRKVRSEQNNESVLDYFDKDIVEKYGGSKEDALKRTQYAFEAIDNATSINIKSCSVDSLARRLELVNMTSESGIHQVRKKPLLRTVQKER